MGTRRGANRESTNEAMSLRASRLMLATEYSGEETESVRAMTSAPFSRAYFAAFRVRWE